MVFDGDNELNQTQQKEIIVSLNDVSFGYNQQYIFSWLYANFSKILICL